MRFQRKGTFEGEMIAFDKRRASARRKSRGQDTLLSEVSGLSNEQSELTEGSLKSIASRRASNVVRRVTMAPNGATIAKLLGIEDNSEEDLEDKEFNHSRRDCVFEEEEEEEKKDDNQDNEVYDFDPEFESKFHPSEMRCLALVAHNHMKPAMKDFVIANKNVLKKFMLTGTRTTMAMLEEVFGDDKNVLYGPTCTSGPLGGDAELVAIMCSGRLGGVIFFTDPMSAHPHSADIECLNRQANVHNILMAPNSTTAQAVMSTLRFALSMGIPEL